MRSKIFQLCFIFIFILHLVGSSQNSKRDTVNVIRSASTLASGNFRDVLTSFFQIAFNDLSSDKKEFSFSSNIFAIKIKTDESLNIDKNFVRQTFARNSNINFSIKLDSNYKFKGVQGGYKYAIINNRDYAISKAFNVLVLNQTKNYSDAFHSIQQKITSLYPEDEEGKATQLILEINEFFNTTTKKFSDLSMDARSIIDLFFNKDIFNVNDDWNPRVDLNDIYKRIIKEYDKKLLWTIMGKFSTYPSGKLLADASIESEATAGLVRLNDRNHIEFNIKAKYEFVDNLEVAGRDLDRQVFTSDFGLNWVTRNKKDKSVFELKATGGYNTIFRGKLGNEKKEILLLTTTLRFRVTNDIWIPLEIKYDPSGGNVFGFLNVRSNFDLLNNLFGRIHN